MTHKTAIVTGGGSGTGREVARRLTESGTHVILWGRNQEKLRATLREQIGAEHAAVDIADATAVDRAVRAVQASGATPTLFVHCAGVWTDGQLSDIGPDDLVSHIRTVVDGSVNAARAALALVAEHENGHLVQIAAASAKAGYPDTALNTLAKRAQDGLQEGLRRELRTGTMRVSTVYPDSIGPAGSEAVTSGMAMSYSDVADAVLFVVGASVTMAVEEIVVTGRRTGRWDS